MSIQQRNEIEELKRRVAVLEEFMRANTIADCNSRIPERVAELEKRTLTLPEKRKSA